MDVDGVVMVVVVVVRGGGAVLGVGWTYEERDSAMAALTGRGEKGKMCDGVIRVTS